MMLLFKSALRLFLLIGLCLSLQVTARAQEDTCPTIVQTALDMTAAACDNVGRNEVCYGNNRVEIEPRPDFGDFTFAEPGDLVNVAGVQSLRLGAMDVLGKTWGVSMMKIQANLPDTLPGQNVTFLLFGDVELQNAADITEAPPPVLLDVTAASAINVRGGPSTNHAVLGSLAAGQAAAADGRSEASDWLHIQVDGIGGGWVSAALVTVDGDTAALPILDETGEPVDTAPVYGPMQAFYFRSGVGDSPCAEAPDSGILIQTPEGGGEINLVADEVLVTLGSTAYLQAQPGGSLTISVVEGRAVVTAFDSSVMVPAGARVQVPLDADLAASGPPGRPEPYDEARLAVLPVGSLERPVAIAPAVAVGDVPMAGQWQIVDSPCARDRIGLIYTMAVEEDGAALFLSRDAGGARYERIEPGVYRVDHPQGTTTAHIHSPTSLTFEWKGCSEPAEWVSPNEN